MNPSAFFVLRDVAFAGRGHDLDDSASYPRACLDVFQSGREQSRLFLTHREQVLPEVGRIFFLGPQSSCLSACAMQSR